MQRCAPTESVIFDARPYDGAKRLTATCKCAGQLYHCAAVTLLAILSRLQQQSSCGLTATHPGLAPAGGAQRLLQGASNAIFSMK